MAGPSYHLEMGDARSGDGDSGGGCYRRWVSRSSEPMAAEGSGKVRGDFLESEKAAMAMTKAALGDLGVNGEDEEQLISEAYLVSSEQCMARCGAVLEQEVEGLQNKLLERVLDLEHQLQELRSEAASDFEHQCAKLGGRVRVEERSADMREHRIVEMNLSKLYQRLSLGDLAHDKVLENTLALLPDEARRQQSHEHQTSRSAVGVLKERLASFRDMARTPSPGPRCTETIVDKAEELVAVCNKLASQAIVGNGTGDQLHRPLETDLADWSHTLPGGPDPIDTDSRIRLAAIISMSGPTEEDIECLAHVVERLRVQDQLEEEQDERQGGSASSSAKACYDDTSLSWIRNDAAQGKQSNLQSLTEPEVVCSRCQKGASMRDFRGGQWYCCQCYANLPLAGDEKRTTRPVEVLPPAAWHHPTPDVELLHNPRIRAPAASFGAPQSPRIRLASSCEAPTAGNGNFSPPPVGSARVPCASPAAFACPSLPRAISPARASAAAPAKGILTPRNFRGSSPINRGASSPINRGASSPINRGASSPTNRGTSSPIRDESRPWPPRQTAWRANSSPIRDNQHRPIVSTALDCQPRDTSPTDAAGPAALPARDTARLSMQLPGARPCLGFSVISPSGGRPGDISPRQVVHIERTGQTSPAPAPRRLQGNNAGSLNVQSALRPLQVPLSSAVPATNTLAQTPRARDQSPVQYVKRKQALNATNLLVRDLSPTQRMASARPRDISPLQRTQVKMSAGACSPRVRDTSPLPIGSCQMACHKQSMGAVWAAGNTKPLTAQATGHGSLSAQPQRSSLTAPALVAKPVTAAVVSQVTPRRVQPMPQPAAAPSATTVEKGFQSARGLEVAKTIAPSVPCPSAAEGFHSPRGMGAALPGSCSVAPPVPHLSFARGPPGPTRRSIR